MHSDLKTEAQIMLNSYLAASALHGEWRFGGPGNLSAQDAASAHNISQRVLV
jgi:hypothetical protein